MNNKIAYILDLVKDSGEITESFNHVLSLDSPEDIIEIADHYDLDIVKELESIRAKIRATKEVAQNLIEAEKGYIYFNNHKKEFIRGYKSVPEGIKYGEELYLNNLPSKEEFLEVADPFRLGRDIAISHFMNSTFS